jgi:hypothetical protein
LFPSRRVFLSRSALVLSLEGVLAMACPRWLRADAQQKATPPKGEPSGDLGVSFVCCPQIAEREDHLRRRAQE